MFRSKQKKEREMNTDSKTSSAVLGKLMAGAFLHDFRDGNKTAPQILQIAAGKLKKWLGSDEEAKAFFEGTESMHNALMSALLEQCVLDALSQETTNKIKELEETERVICEFIFLKATGQNPLSDAVGDNGRWAPALWKLKKMVLRYLDLSPTRIEPEDLLCSLKEVLLPFASEVRGAFLRRL